MARAQTLTKSKVPKIEKPKLTWFLDLVLDDGGQVLYEFTATTQLGALRKVRKALREIQVPSDDEDAYPAGPVRAARRTKPYKGAITGELLVSTAGNVDDPMPVMSVSRPYFWDKIRFDLLV